MQHSLYGMNVTDKRERYVDRYRRRVSDARCFVTARSSVDRPSSGHPRPPHIVFFGERKSSSSLAYYIHVVLAAGFRFEKHIILRFKQKIKNTSAAGTGCVHTARYYSCI